MNPTKATSLFLAISVTLVFAATAAARSETEQPQVRILPELCETDLALSAAPEHLREGAGLYLMAVDGYKLKRKATNPFTCIVNRDDPRVLKPTCFDEEGAATIVPKILLFGKRLVQGVPAEKIRQEIAEEFENGGFHPVRRPGLAYMLSRYNRPVSPLNGKLGWFPPHVMFYAPDLTNEDIGHDMTRYNPKQPLPMIGYQGPHGYMIMISDDGTQRSRADLRGCPDWVHED